MSYKAIISKSGYDITDADKDNLIFTSDNATLAWYASGNTSMTTSSASATLTITHNLGYLPFFLVAYEFLSGKWGLLPYRFADFFDYFYLHAYTDATNIYIDLSRSATNSITLNFKYNIFRNELAF